MFKKNHKTNNKKTTYKLSELNIKQKRFCEIYVLNNYNAIDAYMEVYSTKNRTTSTISANKILKKEKAQEYIKELQEEIKKKEYGNTEDIIKKRNRVKDILFDIADNKLTKDIDKIKAAEAYLRHTNKIEELNTEEENIKEDEEVKNLFEIYNIMIENKEDLKNKINIEIKD